MAYYKYTITIISYSSEQIRTYASDGDVNAETGVH